MPSDHDPTSCASVDHQYWTFVAIWCPHRQQFTLRRSTYVETGTDVGIDRYEADSIALGPFDGPADAQGILEAWVADGLVVEDASSPRPPG